MDIFLYIIIAVSYVMFMHFVVGVEKNFTYSLHIFCFIGGAILGWYMDSYVTGLVVAICFHLLLTSSAFG